MNDYLINMAENIETNPVYDFTKLIHDNSEQH
ncbi:Uncharacterised protein [Candidatus Tiddalikarchaeum anstoanum]|nr:Uncharacterised protein [Candidatus Tiddalikarchaeum anstoanum]